MRLDKWLRISTFCYFILVLIGLICFFLIDQGYEFLWIVFGIVLVIFIVLDFKFCCCPHCGRYVRPTRGRYFSMDLEGDYCPKCGGYLYSDCLEWYSDFEKLNYLQGNLQVFEDHAETMLLITYKDGMCIRVGYDEAESEFVITVLENESEQAEKTPLSVCRVFGRNALLETLQKTVHVWRDSRIEYC